MSKEKTDTREADLGRDPVGPLLVRLALPTICAQVVNLLYNIVDRIYITTIFFQPMLMERAAAVGGPSMAAIMPTIISSKSNLKILPMENTNRHMTENTMQNAQIIRPPY